MKKQFMLALSNVRKGKGQAVSIMLFVLIGALLLNTGLLLMLNFGKSYDKKNEEMNGPHFTIVESARVYSDEQTKYIENYTGVKQVEKEEVFASLVDIHYNKGTVGCPVMFANGENPREISPLTLIGKSYALEDGYVYVPYLLKTGGGYELGDNFQVSIQGKKVNYKIAGFTEETFFGSAQNAVYRFYISDTSFKKLSNEFPSDLASVLLSVRMDDPGKGKDIQEDFTKEFFYKKDIPNASSLFMYSNNFDSAKNMRVFIANITSIIFVAFTFVIVAVCLIVIRFRINNSIAEDMTNIGALKAIGYTSRQIITSIALQFVSISVIASVIGIAASYLTLPAISKLLEVQTALIWKQGFELGVSSTAILTLLILVGLVTFASARKIKNMHPLIALRGGINTHNFQKNHFPLEKAHGPLSLLLALKTLLQSKKQSIMIVLIIAAVSFAATASVAIYYNMAVKPDRFIGIIAGEAPDAAFFRSDTKDTAKITEHIKQMPESRKAFQYDNIGILIDDRNTTAVVTEDFTELEGDLLYEGRYPKHENEIALSGLSVDRIGKTIGDKVTISQGSLKGEYLVTGLIQTMNYDGFQICITEEGMHRIQKDFAFKSIYVYLNKGENVNDFIEKVKVNEGNDFTNTLNVKELMDSQFEAFGAIFTAIAGIVVVITVFVVVLVLYMVMKAMLIRRKRELGIQKALGFTTFQLMQQMSLSIIPMVVFGVALGGIAGYYGFNTIFSSLSKHLGLMKITLPSPLGHTLVLCVGLVVLAYMVSMLITWRVRKISAFKLVNE